MTADRSSLGRGGARRGPQWLARLTPLDRDSTPGRIAAQLRTAIVQGHLPPGSRLTEIPLAARLGVSRGPVREAIQRLIQEGLLLTRRRQGVFVADLDPAQIEDLYLARELLEAAAAERLALHPEASRLGVLRAALDRLRRAQTRRSWPQLVEADLEFHAALVASGGSVRLGRIFDTLSAETRLCLHRLQPFYPERGALVDEHAMILRAIEAGDARQAAILIRAHMREAAARLVSRPPPPGGGGETGASGPAPGALAAAAAAGGGLPTLARLRVPATGAGRPGRRRPPSPADQGG